jgi:hypothetical protein
MIDLEKDASRVVRLTKRPLGRILVDGEFISPDDLERAIEEQKHTNERLGEVLVRMGVLDPIDLKAVLSVQGHLASLGDAIKVAAGVRQLLGNLLVQARRITHKQLDLALEEQKRTDKRLGEALVHLGFLMPRELDTVLAFQQCQGIKKPTPTPFRLGEILVAANYITREQLEDALEKQKPSHKKLGEVLVEAGYVQPSHIEHGLKLQRMLLTAALVAALSLSSISDVYAPGPAFTPSSSRVTVTATVLSHATLKIIHQTPALVVTNADIMRGYVEVRAASRIVVKSNSMAGYLLVFKGLGMPFKEVYVQGLENEVQISSENGLITRPYTQGKIMMELSYRFILSEDARPGTYAWPLLISAQPL